MAQSDWGGREEWGIDPAVLPTAEVERESILLVAAGVEEAAAGTHIGKSRQSHGYLQADAYSGYEVLYEDEQHDVTEVACWAHARRKFYDTQSSDIVECHNQRRLYSGINFLRPISYYRGAPERLLRIRQRKIEQARHHRKQEHLKRKQRTLFFSLPQGREPLILATCEKSSFL